MLLFVAFCAFIGVITIVTSYSLWRNKYSQYLPGKKPKFFDIFADAKEFFVCDVSPNKYFWHMTFLDVLRRRTMEYRKHNLFIMWILYEPFACLVKAEAVKELMELKIHEKAWFYKWLEPMLGTGLLTSDVSKWKPRRKLLTPCFHSDVLREFLPIFNENSQKLVEFLREDTAKEFTLIEEPIALLTLDIICETMFGVKIGALGNDNCQFVKSFRKVAELCMLRLFHLWQWPNCTFKVSNNGKEMMRHVQIVQDFTRRIIQEKKRRYKSGEGQLDVRKRRALLDLLLDRHMAEGALCEEAVREEVNTFALAGHETVSTAIAWALYLIGLHSDIQTKIHEELDKAFGEDRDRPALEKDINELHFLDCVLKESMRLYPAAPMYGRKLSKDTVICGHTLPKGTSCNTLTYFLHRDEEVFPDPEKFDPDRFLQENYSKIPDYAYVPFAAGARNCIGQRFSMMEIKVIVSSILRNFCIESLDSRDKVQPFIFVTLRPSIPIRIKLRSRTILK